MELSQTNLAKEKYIADVFAICSNYISKIDDFRKDIYRKLLAGQYDELRNLTKTPELSQAEIKELHRTFDKIFLGIYPDFVHDFNTLLRPEEQIELHKGDLLNTELRIYALVRLGLTDSTAIAKFLHCSVQTVYNTRQRTRAKAIDSTQKFAERVRNLGTTIF
jgi:DNA-binding NarL/FixJ family response regulator